MRFTRYTATLLFVLCVGGVVIVGIVYFGIIPFPAETLLMQILYSVLLALPFIVTPIGVIIVYSARHAFHFVSHIPSAIESKQYAPAVERTRADDSLIHLAIGFLVAILQDFSLGRILNRELYSQDMLFSLEQELQFFQVYLDRGFSFHFQFHHEETYEACVRYRITPSDIVVEVDGLFDYYFERNGIQHPTPHDYDVNPPLIRVPAMMRVRLQQDSQAQRWLIAGFSESVRGLRMGMATE